MQTLKHAVESSEGIEHRALVLGSSLKQVCNHPGQLSGDGEYRPTASAKSLRLSGAVRGVGRPPAARADLHPAPHHHRSAGRVRRDPVRLFGRAELVLHCGTGLGEQRALGDRSQAEAPRPPLLILSLKVGTTGVNLTGGVITLLAHKVAPKQLSR